MTYGVSHGTALVIDARKRRPGQTEGTAPPGGPSTSQAGASLFDEKSYARSRGRAATKSGRLTVADLKALEEQRETEVLLGYKRIEELWPNILSAELEDEVVREWMLEAEKLVEMFRETRNLFLTSRVRVASLCVTLFTDYSEAQRFPGYVPQTTTAAPE